MGHKDLILVYQENFKQWSLNPLVMSVIYQLMNSNEQHQQNFTDRQQSLLANSETTAMVSPRHFLSRRVIQNVIEQIVHLRRHARVARRNQQFIAKERIQHCDEISRRSAQARSR